jgi:CRP-like cAMP-binding protein
MTIRESVKNGLLASLSPADFAVIGPLLAPAVLPLKRALQTRGKRIEQIYFLESGLASVVFNADSEHRIEVGVIGREGVTGMSLIMGAAKSPYDTFMQSAGSGWQLSADDLHRAMGESRSLHERLILFGHTQCVQMASTILANGRYRLSERLARWLLMAQDRANGDTVSLTHEFLSVMLGVRRAGVTTTLNKLESDGLISAKRGSIRIENRAGLKSAANGSYGAAEDELEYYFQPGIAAGESVVMPARASASSGA